MPDKPAFRGGNLTVRSGGTGPDDYLFRLNGWGRWTRVVLDTRTNYWNDLAALDFILKNCERTNYYNNARLFNRSNGTLPTLTATEFVNSCFKEASNARS